MDQSNTVKTAVFYWTLTDPCNPPDVQTIGTFAITQYIIGYAAEQFDYPEFTVSPSYCVRVSEITIPTHAGISQTTELIQFAMNDLSYVEDSVNGGFLTEKDAPIEVNFSITGFYEDDVTLVSRTDQI